MKHVYGGAEKTKLDSFYGVEFGYHAFSRHYIKDTFAQYQATDQFQVKCNLAVYEQALYTVKIGQSDKYALSITNSLL